LRIGPERRPLRIAFAISSLRIGGAELRALGLAERMPQERFEVDFLSFLGAGPLDERGREAGARVHHLGSTPLSATPLPVRALGRLGKMARYATLARGCRYDIVNAWLYPMDVFAALTRPLTGTPIVVAGRFDLLPRDGFGPLSARLDGVVERGVDAIVANSEAAASQERGRDSHDPAKLHVIRNGVEPVEPIPGEQRHKIRASLGARDADLLIGAVGMLRDVKRHALLIDAFADLVPMRPQLRLAIIGEGPMREALQRQVDRLGLGTRIILPGAIADVRPLIDSFDVVASSSLSEGLPNALLEAAAAGKPIVTTAAGGSVEAVIDGRTGLVVPVGDRVALAAALARLASDASLRGRFGAAARAHAETTFGMERYVRQWTGLYERLAVAKGLLDG
jgi:glycosyltransferase involved in cell wall biosynthesis